MNTRAGLRGHGIRRTAWTPFLTVRRPSSTKPSRRMMNNPVKVKPIRILKEGDPFGQKG